jgi:hypothetical protein
MEDPTHEQIQEQDRQEQHERHDAGEMTAAEEAAYEAEMDAQLAREDAEFTATNPLARKLRRAFDMLEGDGFFTSFAGPCCNSCGWREVDERAGDRPAVFFNAQSWDSMKEGYGKCWLQWRGDGGLIISRLREAGLAWEWDGSEDKAICVCDAVH